MPRPISDMMTKVVRSVEIDDTIEKVENELKSHKLSSVPVVDSKGNIFGIISSPDIVLFHAARKNPKAVRAWDMCTYKPIQVRPDASIDEVARQMVKHRIHHVLVTEHGSVIGIVSSLDFVQAFLTRGT